MKRMKAFKYLARAIPFDQFDVLSCIVFAIAFLSNMQPALTESSEVNGSESSDSDINSGEDTQEGLNAGHDGEKNQ